MQRYLASIIAENIFYIAVTWEIKSSPQWTGSSQYFCLW